ncbi:MAG TPA: T9SS type B sorting domain-containing protein, partial [Flavobacterium sp.]|nr:T9SS type B sorting domain-containing protein [Flavobacterium sp.]
NAQTLWVRVTNTATGCYSLTTMDLRVEPQPTLLPPPGPIAVCDADADGFAAFDLEGLVDQMVQGAPGVTVTFHETLTDAELGVNAITQDPYPNNTPNVQFIWVRAQNPQGCFSIITIELNALPSPVAPVLNPLVACDEDSSPQNGRTLFDLTLQTPVILAAQQGSAYQVEYYLTQADAQTGLAPITTPDAYLNTVNPQTVWYRVEDASGDCFNVGSFELQVNLPLAVAFPIPSLSLCDDGPTTAIPQLVFDLTIKTNEIVQNNPGYTVNYYPSYAQALAQTGAIANPSAYTNTANPQTLGIEVISPEGCRSYSTMDIRVLPLPTPAAPDDLVACDESLPQGTELFDLTQAESQMAGGATDLTFAYFTSQQDAQNNVNPIADPTAHEGVGTVWIRVMNTFVDSNAQACYAIVELSLIVNPLPLVAPAAYTLCDVQGVDEAFVFTGNTALAEEILDDSLDVADYTFTYHATLGDAQLGTPSLGNTYELPAGVTQQVVSVRVEDNDTGCYATAEVTLTVAAGATATQPAISPLVSCDTDGVNDGIFDGFNLTQMDAGILGTQAPADFTVVYYTDAQATQPVADPTQYASGSGVVYAAVTNNATGCISNVVSISVTVEALPAPQITSDTGGNTICVDYATGAFLSGLTLDAGMTNPGNYTYQWALDGVDIPGATASTLPIAQVAPGTYSVVVTSTTALGCVSDPATFEVIQSSSPVLVGTGYTVTGAFSDNQTITIQVEGYGNYLYALDDGPWQTSNVFTNVPAGPHSVRVTDANVTSCGDVVIPIIKVIDYPPYFTPNGDGIHDTWNIIGLEGEPSTKIYIFDRYGKLIKQISPSSPGWDGTYNGNPLPSTDYWFKVEYPEGGAMKEFRAHFSLKR